MYGVEQGVMILNLLEKYGLNTMELAGQKAPIMLHSFDGKTVRLWHQRSGLPNSMLASSVKDLPDPLNVTAQYARVVGLYLSSYYNNTSKKPTGLIPNAHKLGLMAHAWTYRDDAVTWKVSDPIEQYILSYNLGMDGIITEFPEAGVTAIQIH